MTIQTDPLGNGRSLDYDLAGNLTRYQDRNERVIRGDYDDLNRLVQEDRRAGADPAPPITVATLTEGNTTDEVQEIGFWVAYGEISGGTFTLTFGSESTAALGAFATAAQVQSALENLSTIAQGGRCHPQTEMLSNNR